MPRPNILLILSDQHSPHAAGFSGSADVDSPALDALAASGTVFDAAYCQSPLCVPSRMSLWSGRYPLACGAFDNQSALPVGQITLPGWLAQHGYVTASAGKMHFRGPEQMHGFQQRPFGDLVDSNVTQHQPDPPETVDGRSTNHAVGRFPFAGVSAIPEALHGDTVVTTESLAWLLEQHAAQPDQPWFFCASYFRPHFPLTAPGRYIRKYVSRDPMLPALPDHYPDGLHPHDRFIVDDFNLLKFDAATQQHALAAYYAAVEYVDYRIGQLLDELRAAGVLDNTVIIYSSDHGEMAGEHGLWWKRTYYEASARVPLIVTGPGIPAGARVAAPVELVDLFPTICDWAGVTPPPALDGAHLQPLIDGGTRSRQTVRSELLGGDVRTRFRMIRDARWKYVEFPDSPPRLFDLYHDPGETTDLIATPPADAPLDDLRAALALDWNQIEQQRVAQRERQGVFRLVGASAVQYRLRDGRVIDGDDHLYDGSSLVGGW